MRLETKLEINEYFSNFIMLYVQYQLETQSLINVILAAKTGELHAFIITPLKLMLELQNFSTNNYLHFPVMPTIKNAHIFFNFLKINVFYKDGKLVYVLSIPMTDNQ